MKEIYFPQIWREFNMDILWHDRDSLASYPIYRVNKVCGVDIAFIFDQIAF